MERRSTEIDSGGRDAKSGAAALPGEDAFRGAALDFTGAAFFLAAGLAATRFGGFLVPRLATGFALAFFTLMPIVVRAIY